jgi:serine/threonine-protein kinase
VADVDGGQGDSLRAAEEPSAPVRDEPWTKPGTVLGDRFVVERTLGSGGMGYVVAAQNLELGQPVAIKLILPARAMSEEAKRRLTREARATARIRSAHVVRIFDVVSKGPGAPYLVMEYLNGETLRQLLTRTGRLPIDRAVDIVVQTCEALAEAHRNGTIHRDLKPSNLFLTAIPGRACFVKVLDFGIAKTTESDASELTQSQALLASPAYASPEQLRASKKVDARSDIWSLGVILYESVTGRLPFGGGTLAEISSEILRDPPSPPSAHRSDLSPELEHVILRCLEKESADRLENVDSLVMALEPFAPAATKECLAYLRDLGDWKPVPTAESDELGIESSRNRSTLTHASVATPAERAGPKWRNRPVLAIAVGTALVLVAFTIVRHKTEPVSDTSPAASLGRDGPTAATALPTPPVVLGEHPKPGAALSGPVSVAPEPVPSVARSKTRPELARTRAPRVPASASVPSSERTEPSSLEALPLDALIDGRK